MSAADMRKNQEELITMLDGGYYKELVRFERALYEEYISAGFAKEEALMLIMNIMRSGIGGG